MSDFKSKISKSLSYWQAGSDHAKDFSQFFYRNKKGYSLRNFFPGAFVYHWHNRWNLPVKLGSVISDLYQEVLSTIHE